MSTLYASSPEIDLRVLHILLWTLSASTADLRRASCQLLVKEWALKTGKLPLHYANMSVQYTAIFHGYKNDYFQMKNCNIFLIFAQNIDFGCT